MAELQIHQKEHADGHWVFEVAVIEGASKTEHLVTLSEADFKKYSKDRCTAKQLVKSSFVFLLEREDKDSILSEFNLSIISRYFPEYPKKIGDYLPEK